MADPPPPPPTYEQASSSHFDPCPDDVTDYARASGSGSVGLAARAWLATRTDDGVTIKEPLGYECDRSSLPTGSSLTPGGLRLDKARKFEDRLIIDFEKVKCCPWELASGLPEGCREYIPDELRAKGISPSQWAEWCDKLMIVQEKSPSVGAHLCLFCFPGFVVQCALCVIFCPISGDHCLKWLPCFDGDWHCGLRKWQTEVNAVLNPLDMHCKLKTYKPYTKAPKSLGYNDRVLGADDHYEMSMWEIALTAAESEKLLSESWDVDAGVDDGCTSGSGRVL